MTTVYCSGLRSDGDPSAGVGVGVARSLRDAFPVVHLVGVAHSARSSGLHDAVFDEVRVERPCVQLQPDAYAARVLERLNGGAWWIPGSAREARRLAHAASGHVGVLTPTASALERLDASPTRLARRLSLLCPPSVSTREEDWRLNAFGREHGWRLRLLGAGHAAVAIDGWRALERVRAHLGDGWSEAGLRLQAHVDGARESIALAAYRGTTLGASHLATAITTAEGTCWGGGVADLTDVDAAVANGLVTELAAAAWTGGGHIDLVRTVDDGVWLIEWHPCFAGWIHGCTLTGVNLPGALLGAATGGAPVRTEPHGTAFVRVVIEIPLRPHLPLAEPVAPAGGAVRAGAYLGGMPDPGQARPDSPTAHPREPAVRPGVALQATVSGLPRPSSTPHVHRVDPAPRWSDVARAVRTAAGSCRAQIAYSIKTDPDVDLLAAARRHGFLAEAISAGEMRRAQAVGFAGEEIVLNGPAKLWPPSPAPISALATFADSLHELGTLATLTRSGALSTRYLGPRLRPPSMASRFGLPLEDFGAFDRLVAMIAGMPDAQEIGLHFHWSSSEAGHATWFDTVETTLDWGRCLEDLTSRSIRCLDLGGGWSPDDFDAVFLPRLPELLERCMAQLPGLELVLLEPGRALAQPLAVVETSVLELRERNGVREAVVDASLAEVPRAGVYPHRILSHAGDEWRHWGRGPDRVLGRLCMEDDVLRVGVAIPDELRAGGRVLLADAGAYDRSMAYSFGDA